MRFFWLLLLTTTLTVTMAFSLRGIPSIAQTQPPAKDDDKKPPEKKTSPKIDQLDEAILRRAKISTNGSALLDFFTKRILPEKERPEIERLVRRLSSADFRAREKATLELTTRGSAVLEVLRSPFASSFDLETSRRIRQAIQRIQENDVASEVPAAAVRLLALQKPAGMNETLIAFLPFTDSDAVLDEIRLALTKNALVAGKTDPVLVAGLTDRSAVRRATVAEVLGRTAFAEHKDALRRLLQDPDAYVRFRVARTLAYARQADAIPILIDTIPDLPLNAAWQVEDFLLQLAANSPPPSAPMGIDKDTRGKCKDAWQAWWKKHEAKIDLAKLEDTPKLLGRTLIVLLDQGRVLELGPDNMPRFEIKNIVFPLDAQLIDDNRVLVAEYHANRVSERNMRGEVLWQRAVVSPLVAQRLPNGNTFVATPHLLLEYDKDNQEVLNVALSTDNQFIMKAMKLANGEIACMVADGRVVRYSPRGAELHSFAITLGMRLFGGRVHMLPTGRVLVPHNAEGKVIEYDSKGKIVWEIPFEQPIAAHRLPNGNTLITSMNPQIGAVEVDRAGTHLWSYQDASKTRVTRAIRR